MGVTERISPLGVSSRPRRRNPGMFKSLGLVQKGAKGEICTYVPRIKRKLTPLQSSRPQVVKKIWEHIHANDLQVPEDKRQIRCDDKMQRVFKTDKIHMFTMNKHLSSQLYPLEE